MRAIHCAGACRSLWLAAFAAFAGPPDLLTLCVAAYGQARPW